MSCEIPLTDASVPTGMKTGVSTSPCGVMRRPARAQPFCALIWNSTDTVGIVADSQPVSFAQRPDEGVRAYVRVSSMISFASMLRPLTVNRPTLTGSLNRLGPALPGLKYSTPFFISLLGIWLCP